MPKYQATSGGRGCCELPLSGEIKSSNDARYWFGVLPDASFASIALKKSHGGADSDIEPLSVREVLAEVLTLAGVALALQNP